MQVEIGKVYEGIVKNIAKYGAFVEFQKEDGEHATGMVHISEISRSYVNEIGDFVKEGQKVRVKVIGTNPQGKISLSMKQTEEAPAGAPARNTRLPRSGGHGGNAPGGEGGRPRGGRGGRANVWEPKKKQAPSEMTFEDMLSRFKQNSEERMCDIKRNTERKNRSRRK